MRVCVFAATGRTGQRVAVRALAAGYDVTAVVRDPSKLPAELSGQDPKFRVVLADARDATAVAAAIADADAIVSAIGNTTLGRSSLLTECVRNIAEVAARQRPGVPIIHVSTVGAGSSSGQLRRPLRWLLGLVLRNAIADHEGAEAALAAGANPSLSVRCVGLTEAAASGSVSASATRPVGGSRISRDDVADFIISHLKLDDVPGAVANEARPGGGPGNGLVISIW